MILASLIIITGLALAAFFVAGFVIVRTAGHVEAMHAAFAVERERLVTAVLSPDALVSLQRIEAQGRAAAEAAAARAERVQERRYVEQEDDRRYEPIGGIVP